jgi:AcrR family transcriptional regulator
MPRFTATLHALPDPEGSPALSRRERKKRGTRARIHRSALELFAARGFDAVTVDEICAAADVAKRTFFLHFPTKDALLLEYGRHVVGEVAQALAEPAPGAAARLRRAFRLLAARVQENAELVRLSVRIAYARAGEIERTLEQSRSLAEELAAVIDAGRRSGEFRRGAEPLLAAHMALACYFAVVSEWARERGPFDLDAALEQVIDLLVNGLAAPRRAARRRSGG